MDIIRFAITNPVKVTVGVLLILLFGAIGISTIPIQLVPNVDEPVITVETDWTGRSPEEVEREIVEEQEDKLKGVSNLKKMTAEASRGRSNITLEFFIGTNLDRALQEVSDKLREVPEYPADVDEPVITAADSSSENAIAWMILDSTDPYFDIQGFHDITDKRIKPYLERVKGLSQVNIFGGRKREVHIRVDPRLMAQRGVTFTDLRQALRVENVNVSAGDLSDGRLDVRIRTVGQYDNLDDIRRTVVAYTDGGPVTVSDLGDVVHGLEKRRGFVRATGKPALAINAIRETGANVIEVMDELRNRIRGVNESILPLYGHGLKIRQVYDETGYIYDALDLVSQNLWIGGTLAVVVLLVFLRTVWPTLIIALAIPVSVVGTFVAMVAFGRNLNVISIAGMAFAVGMVVDNAIVVLENIDRHLGMGKSAVQAAYDGAKEVWGAVLASTLTTLAVFIPVLTIEEEAGQLFRDIALAICAAVALSLVVSVTVIPAAAARWLRGKNSEPTKSVERNQPPVGTGQPKSAPRWLSGIMSIAGILTRGFADLIYRLASPGRLWVTMRLVVIGFFVVLSLGVTKLLLPPTSYLPKGNMNLVFGVMLTPPSYSIDHKGSIALRVEEAIRPFWEASSTEEASNIRQVINPYTGTAYPEMPAIENYFFVSWGPQIFMGCSSQDKELILPLGTVLGDAMGNIPGSFGFAQQASLFGRGLTGSNSIDVEITGPNLDSLRSSAEALYNSLTEKFGFMAVRPDPLNFNLSGPELQVKIDQVRAKDLNLDVAALGLAVEALVDGAIIGDFRLKDDSIDLLLVKHPNYSLPVDRLGQLPLAALPGEPETAIVPLGDAADLIQTTAPQQINRIEQRRSIKFTVTPPDEVPLETATNQVIELEQQLRQSNTLDRGVEMALAGTADKLVQVRRSLIGQWKGWTRLESYTNLATSRMFLSLLITFLLMAALFESFLYPFVIMFSVPLAAVGGVIGLQAVRLLQPTQQLDVLTMLGFVILIGVVVNNAILIVHQALNFMRGEDRPDSPAGAGTDGYAAIEKLPPQEAIRESVRTRTRPVFMTMMTSVCGMLPLVLMPGSGSELYKGLGGVVVGGLLVATVFTLVVVPLTFSLVIEAKIRLYRAMGLPVPELGEVQRLG